MKLRHLEYGLWTLVVTALLGVLAWGALVVIPGTRGRSGTLAVETVPSRASAWIDAEYVGTTPVAVEDVPAGEHVLRLSRYGHVPVVRRVRVEATGNAPLRLRLEKLPGGSLEVRSSPPGAEILIDGESRGRTPLAVPGLAPGTCELRLRLVNYLDWTETLTVEPGEALRRDVALRSRTEAGYLAAIIENPRNLEARTDLAHYYILRDEWKKAEDAFTEALVTMATHPSETSHYASRLYQEVEKVYRMMFTYSDLERGRVLIVTSFVRAARIVPEYEVFYRVALHYAIGMNATDRVRETAEAGLLNLPESRQWLTMGLPSYVEATHSGDAEIKFLEERIAANPKDFVCRLQLAVGLRHRGRIDDALKHYEALVGLTRMPRVQAQLLADAGKLWESRRDYVKAAEAYRKAADVETEPKPKAVFGHAAARNFAQAGRPADELAAWERAVASQPDVEVACEWRIEWAKLCIREKQEPRARVLLTEVLKLSKNATTRSRAEELLGKS